MVQLIARKHSCIQSWLPFKLMIFLFVLDCVQEIKVIYMSVCVLWLFELKG